MQTILTKVANGYILRPPDAERHCSIDSESMYVFGTFKELADHLEKLMPLDKEAKNV